MKPTSILLVLLALVLLIIEPSLSQTAPDSSAQSDSTAVIEQLALGGFSIFAGVSLPVGAFGATSGDNAGMASTGFVGGIEYALPLDGRSQTFVSVSYSYNKVDDSPLQFLKFFDPSISIKVTSWTSIGLMGGLRFIMPMPPKATLFIDGQVGVLYASSPEIDVSGSLVSAHQNSANAFALALAIGGGFSFGIIDLSAHYRYAQPTFHVKATGSASGSGTSSQEEDIKQPTTSILVVANLHF